MDLSVISTVVGWFLGGFALMVAGMGGPLVALPIMTPFFDDLQVVVLVGVFVAAPSTALLLVRYWKSLDWKKSLTLTISCMPGAWAGVLVLKYVPVFWLEVVFGVMLAAFAIWQAVAKERSGKIPEEGQAMLAAYGVCSGFISGSVSLGGPPLAICAYTNHWDKDMARAAFAMVFVVSFTVSAILDMWHGLMTEEVWDYIGVGIPAMLVGMAAGLPAARRISQRLFRWLLLAIVFSGGITLLYKAIFV